MPDLATFRQWVYTYRVSPQGDGRRRSQHELATAINLNPTELSNRLHGTKQARLTCENVQAIVRTLATWGKITTRAQAEALLAVMECAVASVDWDAVPFRDLEARSPEQLPARGSAPDVGVTRDRLPPAAPQDRAGAGPVPSADRPQRRRSDRRMVRLPTPLSSLIGRDQEVAVLQARLRQHRHRLFTLTGPGGVGKTRLALQVAAGLIDDFEHGVVFIGLASITDPDQVLPALARALALASTTAEYPVLDFLIGYLQPKQLLLVLDNVEQVVGAGTHVVALLEACPRLEVLVTTREALNVRGEQVVSVPPLALPDLAQRPSLEQMQHAPAVALFLERAQEVVPELQLAPEDIVAMVVLCTHLDGLPLAIELAAAQSHLFSPRELLARWSSAQEAAPFALTRGGKTDLPPRQQTLRATIDWSYTLLSPDEQRLLAQLTVFPDGFTLAAAQAVCTGRRTPAIDVSQGVAALVRKNLLVMSLQPHGMRRFSMLETVQAYARERLVADDTVMYLERAYARYYLDLAEAAALGLLGPECIRWLQELDLELVNVQAAFECCLAQQAADHALRLASALVVFWELRGNESMGRGWLEIALTMGTTAPTPVRANALLAAGQLACSQRAYGDATALLDESRQLYHTVADPSGLAKVVLAQASLARSQGDYARAAAGGAQALTYFRDVGDLRYVALALSHLGEVGYDQGDQLVAAARFQEALGLFQRLGYLLGIAWTCYHLGRVAQRQGQYARATVWYHESVARFRALGALHDVALVLDALAALPTTGESPG